jgi:hypothetical protein
MSIPTINAEQVTLLENMANGLGAFSQAVPEEAKDGKECYEASMAIVRDNEQLVILGLIKEITDQCGDKLATMFAMTSRLFRVYELTEVGKAMFGGPERKIQ